ncbi:MAG: hypothetical protein WBG71_11705 [Leeuwenhoekiella sp.]
MKIFNLPILLTVALSFLLGYSSIYLFDDYGWLVFIFLPLFIGFLPGYMTGRKTKLPFKRYRSLGFKTLFVALLLLVVLAIEGIICIAMALPLFLLLTLLGCYLAYKLQSKDKKLSGRSIAAIIALLATVTMSFDHVVEYKDLFPVETTVRVNAPIDQVWQHVITFDSIAPPTDWVLKTGISYPTHATIDGKGKDAIRYCNFTTGSFVEPITNWQEPNLLQFDVLEQPVPMTEVNPFHEVHPPHLEGYFESKRGQFELIPISENETLLKGTTFYQLKIGPQVYWKLWSDFIIHRIHKRVLNHIKQESEK